MKKNRVFLWFHFFSQIFNFSDTRSISQYGRGNLFCLLIFISLLLNFSQSTKAQTVVSITDFATNINGPAGLAFDANGNLFCAAAYSGLIYKIDAQGNKSIYVDLGHDSSPIGLVFDSSGNLYSSHLGIYKIAPDQSFTNWLNFGDAQMGLVIGPDQKFLASTVNKNTIVKFDADGSNQTTFKSFDPNTNPNGMAFDSQGNLYVACYRSGEVIKIDPNNAVTSYAIGGGPSSLAIDASGNVFVASQDDGSISKITPNGTVSIFLPQDTFRAPFGMAFDPLGNLYVSNSSRTTVSKITLTTSAPAYLGVAFSLRKLYSDYTGPAIQVRRSSDDSVQDFGFTAGGDLDSTAISTFADSGGAFVTTWYDQSGNGRNLTKADPTYQPQLVSQGGFKHIGRKIALDFSGGKGLVYEGLISFATVSAVVQSEQPVWNSNHAILDGAPRIGGLVKSGEDIFYADVAPKAVWRNCVFKDTSQSLSPIDSPMVLSYNTQNDQLTKFFIGNSDGLDSNSTGSALESEVIATTSLLGQSVREALVNEQEMYYGIAPEGCTIPFTIDQQPSSSSQQVCLNGSAQRLHVSVSDPSLVFLYQWFASDGNISWPVGDNSDFFTPPSDLAGSLFYYVEIYYDGGGLSSDNSGIITTDGPVVHIAGSTTDCSLVSLVASGGTTYLWDSGSSPNTAANTFNSSGLAHVTVSDTNGCASTSELNIVVVPFSGNTKPLSIYNPDFSSNYQGGWQLNGDAIFAGDPPSYLRLTPDDQGQSGSAFWKKKLELSTNFSFSTYYEFKITPGSRADGLTFCIQQATNTAGGNGGGLGYLGLPGESIAIEYDTYINEDPDNNHIALDMNGVLHGMNEPNLVSLDPDVLNLADGATKYNWVDYDGINNVLEVRISNTSTRPIEPTMRVSNLSLADIFPNGDVFFGFTGATGADTEEHAINAFYVNNAFDPFPSNVVLCNYTQASVNLSLSKANDINCSQTESLITVTSTDQNGNPVSALLNLTIDSGSATLVPTQVETNDQNGQANFWINNLSSSSAVVRVTSADGGAFETITVNKLEGGTLSGVMSACSGGTSQLSTDLTGGTWSSDDLNIATVDGTGLVTAGLVSGDAVITYTPSDGLCPVSGTFSVVAMAFENQPNIISNIPPTIQVSLTNSSGVAAHYLWYSNATDSNSGGTLLATHINSENSDQFTPENPDPTAYYYCVVDNENGCSITSYTIQISALPIIKSGDTPVDHVSVLVVAGGGGGGGPYIGGGGGAGGVNYESSYSINTNGTYQVTVGTGGTGGQFQIPGMPGSDSQFGDYLVAIGGAGGVSGSPGNAIVNGPSGGDGFLYDISGSFIYYGGGGGGGSDGIGGAGGQGGGGAGGSAALNGSNALPNTGGGGGGAGNGTSTVGGNGGSGIVIVKYLGSPRALGGIVTYMKGYTYHTFSNVGTSSLVFNAAIVNVAESRTLTCAMPGGTWSSADETIAVIDQNLGVATGVAAGQTTITYTYVDNLSQSTQQVTYTLTVIANSGLGSFDSETRTVFDGSYSITPPTSSSTGTITYSSSNPSVATIDGTTVTLVSPGVTVITATQTGDLAYFDSSISALLTVNTVSVLTKNGEITTNKKIYVDRYGALGGFKGLSSHGRIVQAKTPVVVTNGLELNLEASSASNDPTGTIWYDLTANHNNGTLMGGVGYNAARRSFDFDGASGYITGTVVPFSSANFSVEYWINPSKLVDFNNQISLNSNFDWTTFVCHNVDGGGAYVGTSLGDRFAPIGSTMTVNAWNQCTFTYSNTKGAFYVNGVLVESTTFASLPSVDMISSYFIGQPNANTISGRLAVFRLYNRALSSTEVLRNFDATKSRFTLEN